MSYYTSPEHVSHVAMLLETDMVIYKNAERPLGLSSEGAELWFEVSPRIASPCGRAALWLETAPCNEDIRPHSYARTPGSARAAHWLGTSHNSSDTPPLPPSSLRAGRRTGFQIRFPSSCPLYRHSWSRSPSHPCVDIHRHASWVLSWWRTRHIWDTFLLQSGVSLVRCCTAWVSLVRRCKSKSRMVQVLPNRIGIRGREKWQGRSCRGGSMVLNVSQWRRGRIPDYIQGGLLRDTYAE